MDFPVELDSAGLFQPGLEPSAPTDLDNGSTALPDQRSCGGKQMVRPHSSLVHIMNGQVSKTMKEKYHPINQTLTPTTSLLHTLYSASKNIPQPPQ